MVYKQMYLKLFNAVTDALTQLEENGSLIDAINILKQAQIDCEEIYLDSDEEDEE